MTLCAHRPRPVAPWEAGAAPADAARDRWEPHPVTRPDSTRPADSAPSLASHPAGPSHQDEVVRIGDHELVIRQRYEVVSILNDVLIGVWFLIGSFFFFSSSLMTIGTCLFVLGSVEMLIRPGIRLARHLHLKRLRPDARRPTETAMDF